MPETGADANLLVIVGEVIETAALRKTPTGVAVAGFRLQHQSRQIENGIPRDVACELEAVAIGPNASMIKTAGLGSKVRLEGFLAQKSLRNQKLVLHVEKIEFLEGHSNGIQTESRRQA